MRGQINQTLSGLAKREKLEFTPNMIARGAILERNEESRRRHPSVLEMLGEIPTITKRVTEEPPIHGLYTPSLATDENVAKFQKYVGYWILDTIDDFQTATIVRFYVDEVNNRLKAKWYAGLQTLAREINALDIAVMNSPVVSTHDDDFNPVIGDIHTVEILPPSTKSTVVDALRLYNNLPVLSQDNLFSTFSLKPDSSTIAWVVLWTDWDGGSDNPDLGFVETAQRYIKVGTEFCLPSIQPLSGPFAKNYRSARTLYEYARDYFLYLGQPQKIIAAAWPAGSITNYRVIADNIENVGVTHTATSTLRKRGNPPMDIGVWKTQYPKKYPITTIHTDISHHFGPASVVNITGFLGDYQVLNGKQQAAAFPPFAYADQPGEPWVKNGSKEYPFYFLFDSSHLPVYKASIHGRGSIKEVRDPLTVSSGYRETIAAIFDLIITAFGPQTHTRIRAYRNDDTLAIYESWDDLDLGINGAPKCGDIEAIDSNAVLYTIRTRNFISTNYRAYWNPHVLIGKRVQFAPFEINDPFKLGLAWLSQHENYDIDLENYLSPNKIWNMYFTVTGPIDSVHNPIQKKLKAIGYSSNGSLVKFTTSPWGHFPADLVDEFGTHPWMLYGAATNDCNEKEISRYSFFFGLISPSLTDGEVVGYIRIGSEGAMDDPVNQISERPLAFKDSIPGLIAKSNMPWVGPFSAAVKRLNAEGVTKLIIDSRNNAGGFDQGATAIASVFGGNRPSALPILIAGAGDDSTSVGGTTILNLANVPTWGNVVAGDLRTIDVENVKSAMANLGGEVFQGTSCNPKKIIFLNSTGAGSGGDEIPHAFIGSNINTNRTAPAQWDIGGNVKVTFVGNLDGVLKSGLRYYDLPPLTNAKDTYVGVELTSEAGFVFSDRYGSMALRQPWMAPQKLLPGWFDDTTWPDLGKTLSKTVPTFPLIARKTTLPIDGNQSTYRDSWLEASILS